MPFPRFQKMSEPRRERLLRVAAQEFAAEGFEAASLNRILLEAKIGKSSAYYYFEDKADLFATVVAYCVDQLQLALSSNAIAELTAESFWGVLAESHCQPLMRARAQPWLFGAARSVMRLSAKSLEREPLASLAHSLMGGVSQIIERGQDLGVIRHDLPSELLVAWFTAVDSASDDWLLAQLEHLDDAAVARISDETIAAIRRALAVPELELSHE
jgi:AcrR family transcriptional regulator